MEARSVSATSRRPLCPITPPATAADRARWRLDHDLQHARALVAVDREHMQPVEPGEQVTTRAVGRVGLAARSSARRGLGHQSRPSGAVAWTHPILNAAPPLTHPACDSRQRNSEEPDSSHRSSPKAAGPWHAPTVKCSLRLLRCKTNRRGSRETARLRHAAVRHARGGSGEGFRSPHRRLTGEFV